MKGFLYSFYAVIFNIFAALFRVKENRVAFISMHNENFNDGLGSVHRYLKELGGYEFVFISRRDLDFKLKNIPRVLSFFFVKPRLLARSRYVFLNDNFMPMAKLNFRPETTVTQLWHAEGVFKKFGLAIDQPEKVRQNELGGNRRLTYVVCSSQSVVPFYAEAFGVPEKKVLPLGSPRTDLLFAGGAGKAARSRLDSLYPQLKGKKLVLYAPTFRDEPEKNRNILSHFDMNMFDRELGREYALLVRLHPQVHQKEAVSGAAADVTDFDDVCALVLACDVLVTDYSSICMDFSLLDKKTIFFAYDLDSYRDSRNFYFTYEDYIPGKVVTDTAGIIDQIKAPFDKDKNERFKRFNFDHADGNSAKRVVEKILKL